METSVTFSVLEKAVAVLVELSASVKVAVCVLSKIVVVHEVITRVVGWVNVPADFDTIEKAFSGVKTAEKGIKQGLSRSDTDFKSPFRFIQLWIFDVSSSNALWGVSLAVYGFWNN